MTITHAPLTVGSSDKPFRIHFTYGDNGEINTARARLTAYTAARELKAPVYIIRSESTWEPVYACRLTVTDQDPSETPGELMETATAEHAEPVIAFERDAIVRLLKAAAARNKAKRAKAAPSETASTSTANA